MKPIKRKRNAVRASRNKLLPTALLLFSFSFVQISFVPASYSALALPPSAESVSLAGAPGEYELDSVGNELTFIDYEKNAFAIFSTSDSLEVPLTVGKVEVREGQLELVPTREIETLGDLYLLTNPKDPSFLQVVEKLPEGGFGRLLRHRGITESGEWMDLEFVYEDRESRLTILDHAAGVFFRTTFTEKRPDPASVFPKEVEKNLNLEFSATEARPLKFTLTDSKLIGHAQPEIEWLHTQFESRSDQEIWMNQLVRGPPGEVFLP